MENLHFTPQNLTLLILNTLFIFILAIWYFKLKRKEYKLEIAMDHYNLINNVNNVKDDFIVDTSEFRQKYDKSLKLIELIEGDKKDYYKKYYSSEAAKVLGLDLLKKGAIEIQFIEGVENDTIIGKVKYLIEV